MVQNHAIIITYQHNLVNISLEFVHNAVQICIYRPVSTYAINFNLTAKIKAENDISKYRSLLAFIRSIFLIQL